MTSTLNLTDAAIGGCDPCRQLWLVTPNTLNCQLCGQPPTHAIPFPLSGDASSPQSPPASDAEASPDDPIDLTIQCPYCERSITITTVDEDTIASRPPPLPPVDEADAEVSSSPASASLPHPTAGPEEPTVAPANGAPPSPASTDEGPNPAAADSKAGPEFCPNHPTEPLDEHGECAPCKADAEARLRATAQAGQEPAP